MVKYIFAALVIGLSLPNIANASSISAVNVKRGELLLEVSATGISVQKASKIIGYCSLDGNAESEGDAKRDLENQKAAMKSRLTGSSSFDFSAELKISSYGVDESVAVAAAEMAANAADAVATKVATEEDYVEKASAKYRYSQEVIISARNAADFERAVDIASDAGCNEYYRSTRAPVLEIADIDGARKLAIKDAIGKAKAQAQEYAKAFDMEVVTMLRVSETDGLRGLLGPDLAEMIVTEMKRNQLRRRNRHRWVNDEVTVSRSVSIDFILAPK